MVIATVVMPPSPLILDLMIVVWESSQLLRNNAMQSTGKLCFGKHGNVHWPP